MSLKSLFSKVKSKHILSNLNVKGMTEDVESGRYIDEYIKRKVEFEPHVDYTTASNFAKFGLAEEYYDAAIRRIYQQYPYDGSSYEKIKWINESNGLDLHVFENEYPRSHGYALFSPSGWGARTSVSGNYGNPATKEYIYIKGGPNIDNTWHTASNRTSNLEIDGNRGNTVEFWLKKDGYQALTKREVIFDSRTINSYVGDHNYGRMTIELDSTNSQENSPWIITYRSGSAGIKNLFVSGTAGLYASASDGQWHHYAFSFQNTGSQVSYRMYVDGELNHSLMTGSSIGSVNTAIVACIGALVAGKDDVQKGRESSETVSPGLGYGKLSGSIDEFRYWKTRRSSRDIGRNWFTQVHGGTNTDDANTDLGVYYKFNEGKTLTSSIDKVVLDYSGRVTNGDWIGYSDVARSTKSAIIQSSASATEFADPIIHLENPKVNKYIDDTKKLGRNHDINSNSCIYYSFPGWIVEEEQEDGGELKKLSQIIGSYFDELFLQIEALSKIKHIKDEDYDMKPNPFMQRVLESVGFEAPEIFIDADVLASLAARDEDREYEQRLEDVKNLIYRNIYNNLVNIYKSKGTEKAFRNLLRCYGIDEELIKINTYSDGVDYHVDQDYREDSFKSRCINFGKPGHFGATVYQYSSSFHKQDKSSEFPISGYITGAHAHDPTAGLSFTTEAEIVFPYKHRQGSKLYFESPLSASLFGSHTVPDSLGGAHDLTWRAAAKDFANFEVYAVKNKRDSRNAKFVFKSTSGIISPLETKLFYDVYDGQKWNFAVRVTPKGKYGNIISGSTNSYVAEFFGVKSEGSQIKDEFILSAPLTKVQGERFHQYSKRLFIGAHRRNFTGSAVCLTDVKVSSLRHWLTYLDNDTIRAHSKDPKSFGVLHPMRNQYAFQTGLNNPVPAINTLALSWDFNTVTGSTKGGQLIVEDFSSGSLKHKRDYGWVGDVIGTNHPGRGDFFPAETTASISTAFFHTARQHLPESIQGSDMVQVLTNDDRTFTRESRPVNYYFSVEKSMYQTISQEMLDMFATIKDFSNLIGEPVNRYRPNYKSMEKLRQLFFEKIDNVPSIEKYIEFYKWVDASISIAMDQLKPASANFSEDVRNIIESHALERNKYWTKFPTLEGKNREPSSDGQILSVNELTYNWRFGHAVLPPSTETVAATATITTTGAPGNNEEFILTDANGLSVTYIFKTGVTTVDGSLDSGKVIIGVSGAVGSAAAVGDRIRAAITASNLDVTVAETGAGRMSLTQNTKGSSGNTQIDMSSVSTTTATNFTGGVDRLRSEKDQCLWWHERAERDVFPLSTGIAAVDKDRNTLRRVINTDVSGSNYTLRRLTKPYRLQAELQPVIHAGSNFHLNKKKDFYLGTTNPNEISYIRISGSDVDFGKECRDVHNPRYGNGLGTRALEKKKVRAAADIGGTNSDHDADLVMPFSLYSSSIDVPTDYKAEIYNNFKKSVEITNLHSDAYGDDREIPIQSPFTQHWVGGHSHRHQHLNIMRPQVPQPDATFAVAAMTVAGNPDTNQKFTLTDNASPAVSVEFTFSRLNNTVNATSIGIQAVLGNNANIAARIKQAIDASALAVTTDQASGVVTITQSNAGVGGNTTLDVSSVLGVSVAGGGPGDATANKFTGGKDSIAPTTLDHKGRRFEAFNLTMSQGQLYVTSPNMIVNLVGGGRNRYHLSLTSSTHNRSRVLREPLAKRPVNIRNIKTTASLLEKDIVLNIGNYKHDYQIVQGTSTDMSPVFLIRTGSIQRIEKKSNSPFFVEINERRKFERPPRKHVFVNRFSAPGGPETAGDNLGGPGLDVATNQYSIYNALNYRNLMTRLNLDHWSSDRSGKFGVAHNSSITASSVTASYHKTYNNPRHPAQAAVAASAVMTVSGNPDTNEKFTLTDGIGASVTFTFNRGNNTINATSIGTADVLGNFPNTAAAIKTAIEASDLRVTVVQAVGSAILTITQNDLGAAGNTTLNVENVLGVAVAGGGEGDTTANKFTGGIDSCRPKYDNRFVQHQIPQTDLAYSWINKSTIETKCTYDRLESKFTFPKAQSDNTVFNTTLASAIELDSPRFVSSSEIGWGEAASGRQVLSLRTKIAAFELGKFLPVDFLGLNTVVLDLVSSSQNTIGHPVIAFTTPAGGSAQGAAVDYLNTDYLLNKTSMKGADVFHGVMRSEDIYGWPSWILNSILLNRNGPFGYPSWKQVRAGDHPVARVLKKQNIVSLAVEKNLGEQFSPSFFTKGNYSWPENIDHLTAETTRTVQNQRYRFTESAVTSRYHPLRSAGLFEKIAGVASPIQNIQQARGNPNAQVAVKKSSYGNKVTSFSNDELVRFLQIDEKAKLDTVNSALISSPINSIYTDTIYPKDANSYLAKVRGRQNFVVDWWSTNRKDRDRVAKPNSQGTFKLRDERSAAGSASPRPGRMNGQFIARVIEITSSIWPLDAQKDFGKTEEQTLIGHPGSVGEGELVSSYSQFRSASYGVASQPMPAALYARKSLETPFVVDLHFGSSDVFDYWNNSSEYDPSNYFIEVAAPPLDGDVIKFAFVGTAESASALTNNFTTGDYIPIVLTGAASVRSALDSPTAIATAFKESVNNNARWNRLKLGRATSNGPTVSLHFNGVWENANWNSTLGGYGPYHGSDIGRGSDFGKGPVKIYGFQQHLSASMPLRTFVAGGTKWEAGQMAGRYPFNYDNYEDYVEQMRLIGKDYSIVPEFRISDYVGDYISSDSPDPFFSEQCSFLKMTGAEDDFSESSQQNFFKVYGHSDFIKFFEVVDRQHTDLGLPKTSLTLKCKALKKFLPYEGVYPVQRSLQLASLFNTSYGPETSNTVESYEFDNGASGSALGSWRTALAPFYAPGLMYNSIKSGIAVDYPVFTPEADRPFNLFCTAFQGSGSNYVNIGQASEWAELFSGSFKRTTTPGFSLNMWFQVRDRESGIGGGNATSGSLISFKDDTSLTEGIQWRKEGQNLILGLYNDASNYIEWRANRALEAAGNAANNARLDSWFNGVDSSGIPKWYNICVTKKLNSSAPRFYVDGQEYSAVTHSFAGTLNEDTIVMNGHSNDSVGNSTIGNHRYGQANGSTNRTALHCAIDEVTIWSGELSRAGVKAIAGGGFQNRGPWRPDTLTSDFGGGDRKKLIGWYRMGDDTGYMTLSSSVANMTNNIKMKNHAFPFYVRESNGILFGTGSNVTKGLQGKLRTLSKATFHNFTDVNAGSPLSPPFQQKGSGITMVGQNSTDFRLTGAFKYPGYITGSQYNETLDKGIPRIGSASWGGSKHTLFVDGSGNSTKFTPYWQTDKGQHLAGDAVKTKTSGIKSIERIPFETIIDPSRFLRSNFESTDGPQIDERFRLYEMEPHPSASIHPATYVRQRFNVDTTYFKTSEHMYQSTALTSDSLTASFSLTEMRKKSVTEYTKASNNFFAESVKFFLAGGETTVISSEDTLQQPVRQGESYKMKIRLFRVPTKDFPMYNRADAFGMPVDAGPGILKMPNFEGFVGHGYAPFTPPHYDSYAEVEYTFQPDIGVAYETIEDVINQISSDNTTSPTIRYNRVITLTGSLASLTNVGLAGVTDSTFAGTLNAATASLNKHHAMQLSASFTGLGLSDANLVPIFEEGGRDRDILRKAWVIQSKWESPNLDFTKVHAAKAQPKELTVAKGMWHQTGSFEEAVTFAEIIPGNEREAGVADLSSLLGMHFKKGGIKLDNVTRVPIGQLPEEKVIREAVVAIPFVQDELGNRNFFRLSRGEVYKAVQNLGFPDYKREFVEEEEFRRTSARDRFAGRRNEFVVKPSVQSMVAKMMRYVIPPRMNFLKYNTREALVEPFAMYIFEFEHTLSKRDIAYLWQNLPPDIGLDSFHNNPRDTLKAESIVSHDLGNDLDLLSGQLTKDVRWMVFKVKQRAETNYFKKMQKDRLPLNHPDKALSVENDIFEYGFNWPYDYFSMVELIKLDAEVGFSQSNLVERDMNAIKEITGIGDNTNTASAATAIRSLITLDNSPPEESTKD